MDHKDVARLLAEAEANCSPLPPLTQLFPDLTEQDSYQIQHIRAAGRKESGEVQTGWKIGLTSAAAQRQMQVDKPDFGYLFDTMQVPDGGSCSMKTMTAPKAEGELAFYINKTLRGPGVTVEDVLAATEYVQPAIEIADTRIADWKIKLEDTIADNGSAKGYVLGGRKVPVQQVDLLLTGMTLRCNGKLLSSGTTAEVLGSPARAIAVMVDGLARQGLALEAGSIVLTGSVTAPVLVSAGDTITASFYGMGDVSVTFTE